nr:MAG TPA: hypothetical protein [Caudoviricetes sp.]
MLKTISNTELISRITKQESFDITPYGRHWIIDFIPRENDIGVFYIVLEEIATYSLETPIYHFFVLDTRSGERVYQNEEYEKCFSFVKKQFDSGEVPRAQMFFSNIHLSPCYKNKKMNFCKDCRYFHKLGRFGEGSQDCLCNKEVNDPITGRISRAPCLLMRLSPYFCGADAKWFEEKGSE